jgi:hypothetical protein
MPSCKHDMRQHPEWIENYGTHTVDIAAELATLDTNGYRPLRMPSASDPR